MPTLDDLVAAVKDALTVSPADFDEDRVIVLLNKGLLRVASRVLLPDLESSGTATTDPTKTEVAIPDLWNFHRNIYWANTGEGKISVLSSIGLMLQKVPTLDSVLDSGPIKYLTTRKNNIVYSPSPTDPTTVRCMFYEKPQPMVKGTDVPDVIPEDYQEPLLVSFVTWQIFETVEDGIEGNNYNASKQESKFNDLIETLKFELKAGQSTSLANRETSWV